MPWLSFRTGSSVTRLCSSGRSSQIADTARRWLEQAERGVVAFAPRQQALGLAGDGLGHRPDAATELKRVATDEAARGVGLVELFAPEANRRSAIAIGRLIDIAVELSVGMEHQVLADQPAGICKAVRKTT